MNNQAEQTMQSWVQERELIRAALCKELNTDIESDERTITIAVRAANALHWRQIEVDQLKAQAAALSQTAGVAEPNGKLVGWWNGIMPDVTERSPYGPSVRWGADAEDGSHDIPLYDGYNPIHFTKPILPSVEAFASAVWRDWMTNEQADKLGAELRAWLRAHIAAAPAASGGEDVLSFGDVTTRFIDGMGWVVPCSDAMKYVDAMRAGAAVMDSMRAGNPPAGASVSERARELADEWRHVLDDGEDGHELCASRNTVARFVNAIAALEQALTQQRGEAVYLIRSEFGGWTEQSKAAHEWWEGRETAPDRRILYTTPQPGAEALRELVQRWREAEKRADRDAQVNPGDEAQYRYEAGTYKECVDELESLLARGG